jgi:hypothetical protein
MFRLHIMTLSSGLNEYGEKTFPLCGLVARKIVTLVRERRRELDYTTSDPEEPNLKSHGHEESKLMLCLRVREADNSITDGGTPISFCKR